MPDDNGPNAGSVETGSTGDYGAGASSDVASAARGLDLGSSMSFSGPDAATIGAIGAAAALGTGAIAGASGAAVAAAGTVGASHAAIRRDIGNGLRGIGNGRRGTTRNDSLAVSFGASGLSSSLRRVSRRA
jgi:hypothetical protein